MKRIIDVSQKVRAEAAKVFGVSDKTVMNALTFDPERGDSDKAKRIRQYAKMNGGVLLHRADVEDQVIFDSEGNLRQYFKNGAMLEVEKETGNATIYDAAGKALETWQDVKMRDMETLQYTAERWQKI